MPQIITCPQCQRRLLLPESLQGQPIQCPSCDARFETDIPTVLPADVIAAEPTPAAASAAPTPAANPFHFDVPAAPRKRRNRVGLPAIVAGVVMVLIAVGLSKNIEWPNRRPAVVRVVPEDPAVREQEVRQAFQDGAPLADNEIAAALQPVLDQLGDALRRRDAAAITAQFDIPRLVDELVAQGMPAPGQQAEVQMGNVLGQALVQQAALLEWQTTEIRHVKRLGPDEVVVTVRHRKHNPNTTLKMRWWARRQGQRWRLYDLEDLDGAYRFSAMAQVFGGRNAADMLALVQAVQLLRDAVIDVAVNQDPDDAEKKLRQIKVARLPTYFEAVRLMIQALIHSQRNEAEEALKTVEKAHQLHPDMPALNLIKGAIYNQLGQWDKALPHLLAYQQLLGDDAIICQELGVAFSQLNRLAEARQNFRKVLDEYPQSIDALVSLLRTLEPGADRADLGPRFAKLDEPKLHFPTLAEECRENRDAASLTAICQAMQKLDPQYAPADFNLALAQAWQGQVRQALGHLRAAIAKEPDSRKLFLQELMRELAMDGQALTVYQALPDIPEAFPLLATELARLHRLDELRQMAASQRARQPDHPLLPFCQGAVDADAGRYPQADQSFQTGLAKPPDAATLEVFRQARVTARYHTGQALAAYAEIGPPEDTFEQLANLAFDEGKDELLEKLLDAHGQKHADSMELAGYSWKLRLRQKKSAEAAAIFKAALDKQNGDDQRMLIDDFLQDAVDHGQVLAGYRSAPEPRDGFHFLAWRLIHQDQGETLKQLIEAHRQAHAGDPWLLYFEGQWLMKQEAWDQAAGKFRQAMTADGEQFQFSWDWVRAMNRAGRSLQAYRDAPEERRASTFEILADSLGRARRLDELRALIAARRAHVADGELLMAEAHLRVFQNQPTEAIQFLLQAYEKVSDHRRRDHLTRFVWRMERAGHGLTAYRAVPDRVLAFSVLAPRLNQPKELPDLATLLQEHGQQHGQNPLLRYYQAELHLLRGEPVQAEQCFAAELGRASVGDVYRLRQGLYRARIQLGKTAETYQEYGVEAFESLLTLCREEQKAGELDKLLAAHRQADPDDPHFPAWELERAWLKRDYAGAMKLITEHRTGLLALPRHRQRMENYLVRCLVKLGRIPEAVQEAEKIAVQNQRILLVLAHAAAGPDPAIATVQKVAKEAWALRICYTDPDLGPILKSEPFAPFRARFPEPDELDADLSREP